MKKTRDFILMDVNGRHLKVRGRAVFENLSSYLRYDLCLTGTKVVCAEGDCGACTVMAARTFPTPSENYNSLNSCIAPVFLLDGCSLVSVEGLRDKGELNEVQESMVRNFGGQCGFCTPGFVMSLTNMFEQCGKVDEKKVKNYLTGNLCRCTGYTPILQAALDVDTRKLKRIRERFPLKSLVSNVGEVRDQEILVRDGNREFYAPIELRDAVEYKTKNPDVRIFSSATDLGVQINKGKFHIHKVMSLHLIPELYACEVVGAKARIGAKVNLAQVQQFLENRIPRFAEFLNIFASPQIKNVATLVGNLANASPIADTISPLIALNAVAVVEGVKGTRRIALDKLFLGYKKLDLTPDEIISFIEVPIPDQEKTRMGFYKTSQRRDLDISVVNASFVFNLEGDKISNASLVFGGVGPTPVKLNALENSLRGKKFKRTDLVGVANQIRGSVNPISDVRGSGEYRRTIAGRLFEKFMDDHVGTT